MKELTIKDLIDLLVIEVPDSEKRVEKVYEWYYDRIKIVLQWVLGFVTSFLVAVFVTFSKTEKTIFNSWVNIVFFIVPAFFLPYALLKLRKLKKLNNQYLTTLKLLSKFKKIRPFLIHYINERANK